MKSHSAILLIVTAALIFSIGLLMVYNTSSAEIIDRSLDTDIHSAMYKQFAYGCVGIIIGLIAYLMGYETLLRWSFPLLAAVTFLLAALFVPGVAQTINGARRWLSIFGFSFQPSEVAKIMIPAVFIQWFLKRETIDLKNSFLKEGVSPLRSGVASSLPQLTDSSANSAVNGRDCASSYPFKSFAKILGLLAIPSALILIEPDNGTVAILISLMVLLFLLAKIRWRYWALPLFCLIAIGSVAALKMPHVPDRIRIYLNPELDLRGKGHQPHQAKIAAGSGGLFGRGLGESLQKLNYLPEARSDYIAAIYAEETGFLGMLVLIGLYATFAYAGFSIALNTKEKGAFLLASVLTFLIAIQAFLNLGIVSGLLPSKGMTLPFFSQGGSSLMTNIAIVFLLLDISRKSVLVAVKRRIL